VSETDPAFSAADFPGITLTRGGRDPLVACIGQLAERFGVSFTASLLGGLALDPGGRLPAHQAEPALELLGLNCDPRQAAKLPRAASQFPAILALDEGNYCVAHEARGGDLLIWRP
jgi:ATP-binding cassette subfamily C protein LapB